MDNSQNLIKTKSGLVWLSGVCGVLGSVVPLVLILSSTFLSSSFSWSSDALSDLGVGDQALIFNGAVLLGGVLNVAFAFGLRKYLIKSRLLSAGIGLILAGSVCLGLVGVFTTDFSVVHALVALGYFLLIPFGFLFIGFGVDNCKIRKVSFVSGFGALASILLLPVFIFGLRLNFGFAVPELAECLIISSWVTFMSAMMIRKNTVE